MPPPPPPPTRTVELFDATRQLTPPQIAWLAQHIQRILEVLACAGTVRIRVIDDPEMAKAHEEFAGVAGTTDVLTFDLTDPDENQLPPAPGFDEKLWDQIPTPRLVDTDVWICLDEARRQADQRGYDFPRELLLYVLHGLLHCLGHDDHEEQASALMHRVEDAVLEAIGVGPVFRVGE